MDSSGLVYTDFPGVFLIWIPPANGIPAITQEQNKEELPGFKGPGHDVLKNVYTKPLGNTLRCGLCGASL